MLKLTMFGLDADILVMSRGEYELACHMNKPIPKDFGNFVLSPMPGTLISFAVEVSAIICRPLTDSVLQDPKSIILLNVHHRKETL